MNGNNKMKTIHLGGIVSGIVCVCVCMKNENFSFFVFLFVVVVVRNG